MDVSLSLNALYTTQKPLTVEAEQARQVKAQESKPQSQVEPERERVVEAIKNIQEFVDEAQRGLQFSIDEDSGRIVVKVIARQTGEVLRQLPSEEALELARRLQDAGSLLFTGQV
ncbi:flagellar protein FlaG [Serpens gallinarum]|uniref:Flagellar protein FlaG n=1 Tax=Serpens gallinarum TaxID=2763075 RepID=A0ABR8TRE5_9PSED|nr:flagellar protein FlaG [Serpens gallinarum]MBD7978347.1 flagellar protein FlaG [Serpens gallinarum]